MKSVSLAGIAFVLAVLTQPAFPQAPVPMRHRVLIADEGNGRIHYVNMNNPLEKWSVTGPNRDLQLVGNDRVMVSDNFGTGYTEYNVLTGAELRRVNVIGVSDGINSAFRLTPNVTFLARDGSPAKIIKADSSGRVLDSIVLALDASVRICRPTVKHSFIIGGKVSGMMCEFDSTGKKIWETNAGGEPYMGVRLPNGNTLISNGYGGQMVLAGASGTIIKKFPAQVNYQGDDFWKNANPNFFAGFQILKNGNIVVANWQGHGTGHGGSGYQLIEIDSGLTRAVSYWKQDSTLVSSLHGVLVLDSLDTRLLYSDREGTLAPVLPPVGAAGIVKDEAAPRHRLIRFTGGSCFEVAGVQGRWRVSVADPAGRVIWSGLFTSCNKEAVHRFSVGPVAEKRTFAILLVSVVAGTVQQTERFVFPGCR
jgi:outer membrane protein assembly factor BamB